MRRLLLCLLLVSAAHARSFISGEVLGGQIHSSFTSDGFLIWDGTFRATGMHTLEAGGLVETICSVNTCTLDELRNAHDAFGGTQGGLTVDNQYQFASDGGVGFVQVSFFDVIRGEFLTVTGQAVTERGGDDLSGEFGVSGIDNAFFLIPDTLRWKYTAHWAIVDEEHTHYALQDITLTAVPELDSLLLTLTGLVGLGGFGFFRRCLRA